MHINFKCNFFLTMHLYLVLLNKGANNVFVFIQRKMHIDYKYT